MFLLKQEFDAYKQQNKWGSDEEVSQLKDLLQEEKRKNDDLQFFLEELEIEVSQLKDLLQEEKRKNEDLQFFLEEEEILRKEGNKSTDEVEKNMKALRTKIISLEEGSLELKKQKETVEKELSAEKSKIEHLEKENTRGELQDKLNKLNKELLQEKQLIVKQLEEANRQSAFLKNQMSNMKVK